MNVIVNGKTHTIANPTTLSELLASLSFVRGSVAIALDGTFVPKENWHQTNISDGADIEILNPMQGG